MGVFGTDISENDEYLDLEIEFFELYNTGMDAQSVSERVIENNNESLDSDEDSNNFWLAIADFQWQCKSLSDAVLDKVKDIIESRSDLELWEDLDADPEDIADREQKLAAFLEKISTPKKRAKRRVKKKTYDAIYAKGDLLVYKLKNGNYGGALVIYAEKNTEFGLNKLVLTNINSKEKPTLTIFKKAISPYAIPVTNIVSSTAADVLYVYSQYYKTQVTEDFEMEVIENVALTSYKPEESQGYGSWDLLRDEPSKEGKGIPMKKWIKSGNWFQRWFS